MWKSNNLLLRKFVWLRIPGVRKTGKDGDHTFLSVNGELSVKITLLTVKPGNTSPMIMPEAVLIAGVRMACSV